MIRTNKGGPASGHRAFLLADELCLQVSLVLAYWLRHGTLAYGRPVYLGLALVLVLLDALVALLNESFTDAARRGWYREASATLWHAFLVLALALIYMFALQTGEVYSRVTLLLMFVLHALLGYLTRTGWKLYREAHPAPARSPRNMLVVTTLGNAPAILGKLKNLDSESPWRITGIALTEPGPKAVGRTPVVCPLEDAADYICQNWVDAVYIDAPLSDERIPALMEACTMMGVPTHYRIEEMGAAVRYSQQICGTTVLTSELHPMTPGQTALKRLADILGGLAGSLAALLVLLVVGPLVKCQSPGPVLFRQKRVGRSGKVFTLYKIRTMHLDAEQRRAALEAEGSIDGGRLFKLDFDPRIIGNEVLPDGSHKTGLGDWIRRHSLDEFPQFFNVLAGQMSLVGTRPPTVDEYRKYQYHHRARLSMKPGLTGLWQVSGRSDIRDFEEVVRLDMEYITHWDPGLDLRILAKTVAVVFSGKGAK